MPALDPSALAAKIGAGGDAERPYVSRTLEEIRRQTARLQSTGAAPKSEVDVATQRFLTTNHINADDLDASGLKLVADEAPPEAPPNYGPNWQAEMEDFLHREQHRVVVDAIEETRRLTIQEFDDSFWEKYEADWQDQKKLVLQRLRFQATGAEPAAPMPPPPPPPSGKSTAGGAPEAGVPPSTRAAARCLRSARACTHAAAIARLWKLRADGGGAAFLLPHEVTRQLLGSAAGGAAAETRGKKLLECWRAVQAMAEAAQSIRRSSAEPADDAAYQAGDVRLRVALLRGALAHLGTQHRETLLRRVRDGQASAARGSGRPELEYDAAAALRLEATLGGGLGGGNPMREVVSVGGDDVPVWPLAYLCARSDDAAAAARVLALRRGGQPVPKLAALLNLQAQIKTGAAQGARSGALAAAVAEAAAEAGDVGQRDGGGDADGVCGLLRPDPRASLGAPRPPRSPARPAPPDCPPRPLALARAPPRRPADTCLPLPSPRRSRPDAVARLLHHNRGLDVVQALDRPHVAPARRPRWGGRDGGDARHARHPRDARRPRRRRAAGCTRGASAAGA